MSTDYQDLRQNPETTFQIWTLIINTFPKYGEGIDYMESRKSDLNRNTGRFYLFRIFLNNNVNRLT